MAIYTIANKHSSGRRVLLHLINSGFMRVIDISKTTLYYAKSAKYIAKSSSLVVFCMLICNEKLS